MKTTMKIVTIALVAIMMVMTVSTTALAANKETAGGFNPGAIIENIDAAADKEAGKNTAVNEIAGKILGLIRNIAVVAGVIILSIVGVKFMIGSAEEKAEYKKSLIPLVVGIIIVMGATQIITMVFGFFN